MKNKSHKIGAIKRAINDHISTNKERSSFFVVHDNWYCGVTNNVGIRKIQHATKRIFIYFKSWDAETKNNAVEIEKYFHELKMRGAKTAGGVRKNSKFIYVYKYSMTPADIIEFILGISE